MHWEFFYSILLGWVLAIFYIFLLDSFTRFLFYCLKSCKIKRKKSAACKKEFKYLSPIFEVKKKTFKYLSAGDFTVAYSHLSAEKESND